MGVGWMLQRLYRWWRGRVARIIVRMKGFAACCLVAVAPGGSR
jgi:hypothetical protein